LGDKIKGIEMGEAQDKWSRREMYAGFWWGNQKEGDLDVDGTLILECRFERIGLDGMDWMYLAEDSDRDN
jgi:hypothetical protein